MELFLPFILLIFASFFQGTFGLGMKYMNPLSWEAWWLVHVTIAMIIFPMTWALIVMPDLLCGLHYFNSPSIDTFRTQNSF